MLSLVVNLIMDLKKSNAPWSCLINFRPASHSINQFSNSIERYPFECTNDKKALYIILILVSSPFAASRIKDTISVQILYFIR